MLVLAEDARALRKDISQLVLRLHLDQPHFSILDDLMGEMPTDVNVLGPLTAANDVVTPFNTRRVVLIGVGFFCPKPSRRRSALRYKTSQPAADPE